MPESARMKRIQFCFFDAGGGHRAAATALQTAIRSQSPSWDVQLTNIQELLDELDILRKYAGIPIQDFYNGMLSTGWTLGSAQMLKMLQLTLRLYHRPTVRLFEKLWASAQPDMVVSFVPHFNRAMCQSLNTVLPGVPFVTILTDIADYPPHFWMERQDQYFVCGSDKAIAQAKALGHADGKVFRASGMILHPRFYEQPISDRVAERLRLGLRPDRPTGLVLFGGQGSKTMKELADRLDRPGLRLQLIFICGKNEKLARALRERHWRVPVFVEGYTTRVNYYMQLADFFIGKPGPGSISEALAMKLPVIVECNSWTLPQERYNAEWILEKEVGIVVDNFRHIESTVVQLIQPATLARYRANAAALENRAVFEIPAILQTIIQSSRSSPVSPRSAFPSLAL